jgi:predicted metal-binding protein
MSTIVHERPAVNEEITRHSTDTEKHGELVRYALASGMDRAKIIPTDLVVIEKRAQVKCLIPRCTSYGRSYTCPPNMPSTDEVREIVGEYRSAIFMQVDGSEEKDGYNEMMKKDYNWCYPSVYKLMEAVHNTEVRAFDLGWPMAMGFAGGDCRWCELLGGGIERYGGEALLHANAGGCMCDSDNPCLQEYRARPAMEAMSINVLATARNAGMPFYFSGKEKARIVWNGIVLID